MSKHPPTTITTSIQQSPALPFPQTNKRARVDNGNIKISSKSLIKRSKRRRVNPEVQQNLNIAIGGMDTYLLADYVARHTMQSQTDLSPVELEGLRISGMLVY